MITLCWVLQGVKMGSMRFRFDGQPINETDTPSQLDMEDGDAIDVFQQQTGGGVPQQCYDAVPTGATLGPVEQHRRVGLARKASRNSSCSTNYERTLNQQNLYVSMSELLRFRLRSLFITLKVDVKKDRESVIVIGFNFLCILLTNCLLGRLNFIIVRCCIRYSVVDVHLLSRFSLATRVSQ